MNKLDELIAEVEGKWVTPMDLPTLIARVYKSAIEDAKGALPEVMETYDEKGDANWNQCRAEAITNLQALTKDV